MIIFAFTCVLLIGTSVNDYKSGGVEDFDHAVKKIERFFNDNKHDYSTLNN